MGVSEKELLRLSLDAITEALEVYEEDIPSYDANYIPDPCFGDSVTIDVDFEGASFMKEYFRGKQASLSIEVITDYSYSPQAKLVMLIGNSCTNPKVANEFIDRYMDTSNYSNTWSMPFSADDSGGLMLSSSYELDSIDELYEELVERLSLFQNERFTNELRPFIHYFER
jgi:hypothetical protein